MLQRCSTVAAFYDRIVLLRLASVSCVNWDIRFLDLLFSLLLLAALAVVLLYDHVFQASALLLNVGLVWACRLLRSLCFANI